MVIQRQASWTSLQRHKGFKSILNRTAASCPHELGRSVIDGVGLREHRIKVLNTLIIQFMSGNNRIKSMLDRNAVSWSARVFDIPVLPRLD